MTMDSVSIHQELSGAIEKLYDVFSRYPLKSYIEGGTYDIGPEDHAAIRSKPLHNLAFDDIHIFATHAIHIWGDRDDFRHFLPRILELLAVSPDPWRYIAEIATKALLLADWTSWPELEQISIRTYFVELWHHVRLQIPIEHWLDPYSDYLCVIAQAEDVLSPYLVSLEHDASETSLLRLAQMVDENAEPLSVSGKLGDSFWSLREPQMQQVIEWLLKADIETTLEHAFDSYLGRGYKGHPAVHFDQFRQLRKVAQ